MTAAPVGGPLAPALPDDPAMRQRVLRPYRTHCQYLRFAEVQVAGEEVKACCEFSVDESYYIDSTGHFNAVEYNICYNQAAYYLIAKSVQHQLLPAFHGWTMADFWQRQLSDVLIVEFSTMFQQQIRPKRFYGELTFARAWTNPATATTPPLVAIDTKCRFWDDFSGQCRGRALLAVTNPPQTAAR